MLLVVLNAMATKGARELTEKARSAQPTVGEVSLSKFQSDGTYVIIFDNDLRGYGFAASLKEQGVDHRVELTSKENFAQTLVKLLPELGAVRRGGPSDPEAQRMREGTVRVLVDDLVAKGNRSPWDLSRTGR